MEMNVQDKLNTHTTRQQRNCSRYRTTSLFEALCASSEMLTEELDREISSNRMKRAFVWTLRWSAFTMNDEARCITTFHSGETKRFSSAGKNRENKLWTKRLLLSNHSGA